MTTITTGQQYRNANSGRILEVVTVVNGLAELANPFDGHRSTRTVASIQQDIATGLLVEVVTVTPIDATPAEALKLLRAAAAKAEIERYREAYNAVSRIIHAGDIGTPTYWDAVRQRDIVREIAATAVKATFKRMSLARAREIAIYCADYQTRTITQACAELGYRNR